jgi:nucleotide-binding universal stress UspA family protein
MIKLVMARLDGSAADDVRLSAAAELADMFKAEIVGLFLNIVPEEKPGFGDETVKALKSRASRMKTPLEIRRIDVSAEELSAVAVREARAADTFISLAWGDEGAAKEPEPLLRRVLLESGRHLFVVAEQAPIKRHFDHVLVAWDGSRDAARAMAEALPYLHRSSEVPVLVVDAEGGQRDHAAGAEAISYLRHHSVAAELVHPARRDGDLAAILREEAARRGADLIVMGSVGRAPSAESFPESVASEMIRHPPVPLVVAH